MKFLVVKIGAIGDVLMALPLAQALKELNPSCKVTWVAGRQVQPLVAASPFVDEIIVVNDKNLLAGSKLAQMSEILNLWRRLAARSFDEVFVGQMDRRYKFLVAPQWGRAKVKMFSSPPGQHHTKSYIEMAANSESDRKKLKPVPPFYFQQPANANVDSLLSKIGRPRVVLAPGGAKNLLADDAFRRWPIERYVDLVQVLVQKKIHVLLTGAESDTWVLPSFQVNSPYFHNLIGKTNLLESAALFSQCDAVVSHDTGVLHLATATRTPVVALFGPTNPHEKVTLSHPLTRILWGANEDMKSINVNQVIKALDGIFEKRVDAGPI